MCVYVCVCGVSFCIPGSSPVVCLLVVLCVGVCVWGGVSLCILGCPRVCYVDQNGLKFTEIFLGAGIKGAFHHT